MTDHYYTNQPTSKKESKTWEVTLKGNVLQFKTESGVFSKERVDYGSQVLIQAIEADHFPSGKLLDMGCGYGPIGLSLAKQYPSREVDMIDINERAVDLAKQNAEMNQIRNTTIYTSYLFEGVKDQAFAGIITNPPIRAGKKVVHAILEQAYDYLMVDGTLTIVIQKKQGAPSAKKKMEEVFGNVNRIALDKGYWILQSVK